MVSSLERLAGVFRQLLGQEAAHSVCTLFRLDCPKHNAALYLHGVFVCACCGVPFMRLAWLLSFPADAARPLAALRRGPARRA
jgi:hypothetical protein